jgi:hypothetical protein
MVALMVTWRADLTAQMKVGTKEHQWAGSRVEQRAEL